jgi:site-specific recombinase XerD
MSSIKVRQNHKSVYVIYCHKNEKFKIFTGVNTQVSTLCSIISSHTARRTFISLCLSKGMPIQDVMKISGHSDFKSMKPYMRITRKDIRAVADRWDI